MRLMFVILSGSKQSRKATLYVIAKQSRVSGPLRVEVTPLVNIFVFEGFRTTSAVQSGVKISVLPHLTRITLEGIITHVWEEMLIVLRKDV